MKVLVIADPHIPVPPVCYGGTERMAALFCAKAAEEGHNVCLMAGVKSKDYGGGLWLHRAPTSALWDRAFRKVTFFARSMAIARRCDVVVNFGRIDYLAGLLRMNVPVVNRFANPVKQSEVCYLRKHRRTKMAMVFISLDQKSHLNGVETEPVVYNGVDTGFFCPDSREGDNRRNYLLFVGRLTRNKGVHMAIATARRTGQRLIIAGNIPNEPGEDRYFAEEVRPWLGASCEWVGEVDDAKKRSLMRDARALLFPIQWREPFGIVMAESLACGTPVIAMRNGSVPEVVRHGRTGFVCDSLDDMVAAVHSLDSISREICREDAVNRFSPAAYLQNMLKACERAGAISGA